MSTGKHRLVREGPAAGFTALELLLGVVLTVLLALGTAPLVISMQESGVREGDRVVGLVQARVAVARFERDLRMATAEGCPFNTGGAILQATPHQIVFLGRRAGLEGLTIFEWEIVGSSLMRRWGPCPSEAPDSFPHSLYLDNKTMLEGVGEDASFTYLVNGAVSREELSDSELSRVSGVTLFSSGKDARGTWFPFLDTSARVGR